MRFFTDFLYKFDRTIPMRLTVIYSLIFSTDSFVQYRNDNDGVPFDWLFRPENNIKTDIVTLTDVYTDYMTLFDSLHTSDIWLILLMISTWRWKLDRQVFTYRLVLSALSSGYENQSNRALYVEFEINRWFLKHNKL